MDMIDREAAVLDHILAEQSCFQLKDLAIHGKDLLQIGVPEGPEVGRLLQELLDSVLENRCENGWTPFFLWQNSWHSLGRKRRDKRRGRIRYTYIGALV